jgi:putative toxin-antitoxin system antitoxin component (TIGR02293 family)
MTAVDTVEFLGGAKVFGRALGSELELAQEVARGFPVGSLDAVLRTLQSEAISQSAIYAVVGTARTLQRKRQQNGRLSHDESDRLARLARLAVRAGEALGSAEKAQRWLGKPNRALNGMRPLDLLSSDTGAVLVEDVLGRVEHGVAA